MLTGEHATGTYWENMSVTGGPQLGSYTSLSHGWSAGPVPFLTNQVLGVTLASGGFATFSELPHPDGGPTWAEGTVPTRTAASPSVGRTAVTHPSPWR